MNTPILNSKAPECAEVCQQAVDYGVWPEHSCSPVCVFNERHTNELLRLASEWEGTAAMAEKCCVGDDLFMGEARGLRSAAKELREYVSLGVLPWLPT